MLARLLCCSGLHACTLTQLVVTCTGGFGGFGGFGQRQQHQHQHQQQSEPRYQQQQLEQAEPEYRQQPQSQHKHEHEPKEPQHYEQHQHTPGHHHDASYTSTDAPHRGQDYTHKEVAVEDKNIDEGRQRQAAHNSNGSRQEPLYVQPSSNERSIYEQPRSTAADSNRDGYDQRSTGAYEQPHSTTGDLQPGVCLCLPALGLCPVLPALMQAPQPDFSSDLAVASPDAPRVHAGGRQADSTERSTYEQPRTGGHEQPHTGSYTEPRTGGYSDSEPRTGSYEQPHTGSYSEPRTGSYTANEPRSDEGYNRSQAGTGHQASSQQGQTSAASDAQAPATGGIWSYVPGNQASVPCSTCPRRCCPRRAAQHLDSLCMCQTLCSVRLVYVAALLSRQLCRHGAMLLRPTGSGLRLRLSRLPAQHKWGPAPPTAKPVLFQHLLPPT